MQNVKPDLILDYNVYKTGMDRSEELQNYYPFQQKIMKWWKLFFYIFTMV